MPGNTAYCLSNGGVRMLTRIAGDPVQLAKLNAAIPLGAHGGAEGDR
jgi:hypothetical protein